MSQYEHWNQGEPNATIEHPLVGPHPMQEIIGFTMVKDTSEKQATINFRVTQPGFYRIVFSNEHSWYRSKIVMFRYCVLTPVRPLVEKKPATSYVAHGNDDELTGEQIQNNLKTSATSTTSYQPPKLNAFEFMKSAFKS